MAQNNSESGSEYIGMYIQRSVDSEARLFILDDKTFCFTFMGGALDMIKAGRWNITANGMLNLQEPALVAPIHPATGKNMDRIGPRMVGINFDGYTLSNAYSPVFASGKNEVPPTTFRPLFPTHTDSWAMTYALPLMPADDIKYFYIGDVETDREGRPTKTLRITQYKLDGYDAVRIGFNEMQASGPMKMVAQLQDAVLYVDRQKFGKKQPVTANIIEEVREQCINPVLNANQSDPSHMEQKQGYDTSVILTPVKSFTLDVSVISGSPLFAEKTSLNTTATDSIDDLVETEKLQLEALFEKTAADFKNVDEFLQMTQNLVEKKKRLWKNLPLIMEYTSKLIVSTTGKGDFKSSEKIFFHYLAYVYPTIRVNKDSSVAYNNSVIASQGLVIAITLKKSEVSKIVLDKLIDKDFDIKSHKNTTLIYNLACFYAINNNKKDMLTAVAEVRKRGQPRKLFLDEADFRNYVDDAEFLKAIE